MMKTLLISVLTSGVLLMSGAAWAQSGSTLVPGVTVPSTTQGTSDATSQAAMEALKKKQKEAMEAAEKAKGMGSMKDMKDMKGMTK